MILARLDDVLLLPVVSEKNELKVSVSGYLKR